MTPRIPAPGDAEGEIAGLVRRFGPTLERTVAVGTDAFWSRQGRTREVCMVIRRPSGRLLTATKTFYPAGVYRLLTGGVERGERVLAALLRETDEETGLRVAVRRLLAVIAYRAEDAADDDPPRCHTFAFLLDELGGALGATDPHEQIAAYGEAAPEDLRAIADRLERLPAVYDPRIGERWRDWGRPRAAIHYAVHDALLAAPEGGA